WQFTTLATIAAWLLYIVAFLVLFTVLREATGALALLPVATAAWLRGARAGALTAITFVPINALLFLGEGSTLMQSVAGNTLSAIVFAGIGGLIGHMRESNRRVYELTLFDQTTGLPNRVAFQHEVARVLAAADPFAIVALVRVNGYDDVNESFGYEFGDELLRELGRRISAAVETSAFVAKFDGGTFGILSTSVAISSRALAESALAVFDSPLAADAQDLKLEGRVGVAHFPDHGATEAALLRRARGALHDAERATARWAPATNVTSDVENRGRLETLTALRAALTNGELRLHYQPIVETAGHQLHELEALVRWQRGGRLVSPAEFIPLAERSGLITPLTDWVVNEALRQVREWRDEGTRLRVAVNVSARSLDPAARFAEKIDDLLTRHDVDADQLTVEVTESAVMADPEQSIRVLTALKALGVHIALDDFGTGYSSLSYLYQLPLDAVKIDRSFVQRLIRDANTTTIVRAAIDLSHALGFDVVGEGVESAEIVDRLTVMGCDLIQGFHIAKPMPVAETRAWLDTAAAKIEITVGPARRAEAVPTPIVRGQGTVLVVDDEHPLRVAAHRILSAEGYNVIHAATASEALRMCAEYDGHLDLVLTDVFLTDWRGHDLAEHLRRQYPGLKVMLMSGDPKASPLVAGQTLLRKPFTKRQLVDGVKDMLTASHAA
ncbi:MAG: EAL domain-containing protein, partial [Chloroflexota bacterium]|nr:EAL domain-containing protein [Chloroflexota bacterium]